jgi:hypothetical protein
LDNSTSHRYQPLVITQRKLDLFDNHDTNISMLARDEPVDFDDYVEDSCSYALYHGCQECYNQWQHLYNATMERDNMLKVAGSNIVSTWECGWNEIKTI